jgi:hypothetical protein
MASARLENKKERAKVVRYIFATEVEGEDSAILKRRRINVLSRDWKDHFMHIDACKHITLRRRVNNGGFGM